MRIRWLPSALEDIEGIHSYLTLNRSQYVTGTVRAIYKAVLSLKSFPFRGRPSTQPGIRVMPLAKLPYLVYYRVNEETVEVLHIRHGARELPFLRAE
jgi:plasmid stabilization system protein ParE